jgi:hypothetical protein
MKENVHVIQKQRYEIKTRKQKTALDIQNRIDDINTRHISLLLAESFDKHFSADEVIVIDKLELDLGSININNSNEEWADSFFEKLDEQLRSVTTQSKNEIEERKKHIVKTWIFFLKYGMLQQESFYNSVDEIKNELQIISDDEKALLRSFLIHEAGDEIVKRLIANTSLEEKKFHFQLFFSKDVKSITWQIENEINLNERKISGGRIFFAQLAWQDIFNYITKTLRVNTSDSFLIDVKRIIGDRANKLDSDNKFNEATRSNINKEGIAEGLSEKEESENHIEKLILSSEMFISDAGLCLLAPWIDSFFAQLKLTAGNGFTDNWKQQHAVYLLHYLVTTNAEPTEELLVFPKLLCGWPLQMPVINSYEITDEEKKECDDLLTSVIQNWNVLKNTSITGIRESFLQRAGKLIENDEYFVLQLEQRSIDLLLEYVPWTFRFIRLPWMKKSIQVEWY